MAKREVPVNAGVEEGAHREPEARDLAVRRTGDARRTSGAGRQPAS